MPCGSEGADCIPCTVARNLSLIWYFCVLLSLGLFSHPRLVCRAFSVHLLEHRALWRRRQSKAPRRRYCRVEYSAQTDDKAKYSVPTIGNA